MGNTEQFPAHDTHMDVMEDSHNRLAVLKIKFSAIADWRNWRSIL